MKKNTLFYLLFSIVFFGGCSTEDDLEPNATADLSTSDFNQAKSEIDETLTAIFTAIDGRDAETLIGFHAYGPKFTEFKDGLARTGSVENEAAERGLVEMISSFGYSLNDLQIDVLSGTVAKVTFHADFRPVIQGVEYQQLAQVTLIFIKQQGGWKIIHEHLSPLGQSV